MLKINQNTKQYLNTTLQAYVIILFDEPYIISSPVAALMCEFGTAVPHQLLSTGLWTMMVKLSSSKQNMIFFCY